MQQLVTVRKPLAGDLAIWIFILAELLVFGVFFAAYAFTRLQHLELFRTMQATLDVNAGMVNTLLLVTGSACVAMAVNTVRQIPPLPPSAEPAEAAESTAPVIEWHPLHAVASRWLLAGIVCGLGFLLVKGGEYAAKLGAGISLSTNTFYMFYLSLTFFHFMHVILGLVILVAVWRRLRQGAYRPGLPGQTSPMNGLESGAAYWHMVDLVWIVLFPLVYVLS